MDYHTYNHDIHYYKHDEYYDDDNYYSNYLYHYSRGGTASKSPGVQVAMVAFGYYGWNFGVFVGEEKEEGLNVSHLL